MQMSAQDIDDFDLSDIGIPNVRVLKEMYPAVKSMDQAELLQKLQLIRDMGNLRTSKVDRKLYIGNIPTGLTPQMVLNILFSLYN
jgi:NurA-like 5'-3' nuclease